MANPQHVEWLLEGVEAWNRRRDEGGNLCGVEADFSGLNFRELFENAGKVKDLGWLPLAGYDFYGDRLTGARLVRADLTDAILSSANLARTTIYDSIFTRANLYNANLGGALLIDANFTDAELTDIDLTSATLCDSILTNASCRDANFADADLTGTKLWDAVLFDDNIEVPVQHPIMLNHVESIADLLACIREIKTCYEDSRAARRFYFRGESQCGWKLQPSVMRDQALAENESTMLTDLISRRPEEFNGLVSGLSQLVTAQHHGLKTRFLDITSNPMVALFHACGEAEDKKDGRLHVFVAPRQIVKPFNSDTVSIIANCARLQTHHQRALIGESDTIPDYPTAMNQLCQLIQSEKPYFLYRIDHRDFYRVIIVEPQRSSERIRAQSGAFLVSAFHKRFERDEILRWNDGIPVYAHYQLTIPSKCKAGILEELQMLDITRETLFPGLDSSAEAITEFYRQRPG